MNQALAIDPRAEAELREYFVWGIGALEAPSNFGPMTARLQVGGPTGGTPIMDLPERALAAAGDERRVLRALQAAFGEVWRRNDLGVALWLRYGPEGLHWENVPHAAVFGLGGPVAMLTRGAAHAHRDSHTDRGPEEWLLRLAWRVYRRRGATSTDRVLVRAIASEAEDLLRRAVQAFSSARRGCWRRWR